MGKEKKNIIQKAIEKMRKISLYIHLSLYAIYISYLSLQIAYDRGEKWVNITLLCATIIMVLFTLVFYGKTRKEKKGLKTAKRLYKKVKKLTRIYITLMAIYTLISAFDSDSFWAGVFASVFAVVFVVQIGGEIVRFLLYRRGKKRQKKLDKAEEEFEKIEIS